MFSDEVLKFYKELLIPGKLPGGIKAMNPYQDPVTWKLSETFYHKFYADRSKRHFIFGINPGRFGAGTTGIAFTDPIRLDRECGIENPLPKKAELSSEFVYEMISEFGGPDKFYRHFFMTAVCPLGFVQSGKNLNYYDNPELAHKVEPFILETIRNQISIGAYRDHCICLGEGTNFKRFNAWNLEHKFFKTIIPLAHPRFIMQYKRKQKMNYIRQYVETLTGLLDPHKTQ